MSAKKWYSDARVVGLSGVCLALGGFGGYSLGLTTSSVMSPTVIESGYLSTEQQGDYTSQMLLQHNDGSTRDILVSSDGVTFENYNSVREQERSELEQSILMQRTGDASE